MTFGSVLAAILLLAYKIYFYRSKNFLNLRNVSEIITYYEENNII